MKNSKIAIIGGGNVGIRYAYSLMIKGGVREIVIVDINRKKAEGEVLDLLHGAPYVSPVKIYAGDYSNIKNSDLVVITAGKNQKPGESRLDLTKNNVTLFKKIVPDIVKYAPDSIILVVTNPVDILTYATYKISKKPANKIIGSGSVLDSARFRYHIAEHCKIDPRNVHAYILGEHGDSEFPVWSKAMIGGMFLREYCNICPNRGKCNRDRELGKIFEKVKTSAYEIINKKGETSYGIGLALWRITNAILNNENAILPVSILVDGYLQIKDVYLSLPSIINKDGIKSTLELNLDKEETNNLKHSASTLKNIIKELDI